MNTEGHPPAADVHGSANDLRLPQTSAITSNVVLYRISSMLCDAAHGVLTIVRSPFWAPSTRIPYNPSPVLSMHFC